MVRNLPTEYCDRGIRAQLDDAQFSLIEDTTMTTGRKFTERTRDDSTEIVLDHRTKTILNAVLSERRGNALAAYLKALKQK